MAHKVLFTYQHNFIYSKGVFGCEDICFVSVFEFSLLDEPEEDIWTRSGSIPHKIWHNGWKVTAKCIKNALIANYICCAA